jgi:hypothetical protein
MRHKILDLMVGEVNKQGAVPFRLTLLNDFQKRVQENHDIQSLGVSIISKRPVSNDLTCSVSWSLPHDITFFPLD